jgi:hypothetical protein
MAALDRIDGGGPLRPELLGINGVWSWAYAGTRLIEVIHPDRSPDPQSIVDQQE